MTTLLKQWSNILAGEFSEYSMENRAFNMISGLTVIILSITIVVNFALGLIPIALWMTLMTMLCCLLFYLARFRHKFDFASISFALFSYIFLVVSYFLNAGITGPVVYAFFTTLILNIVITPRRYQLVWIGIHLAIVPAVFLIEYYNPQLTQIQPYLNRSDYFADHAITYTSCTIFLGTLGIFLTSSYNFEKKAAIDSRFELERKNEELEFINKEKDRLFSIIGHDLKSPLNSIKAYLEMLDIEELSPEDRSFLNGQLLGLTHNTSNLLNNLLNWSVRQNLQDIELRPLNLADHLNEVINLMKPEADRKNISFKLNIKDEKASLLGESEMLHLVLRNLLNNAIKFSPANATITINSNIQNGKVSIAVIDTGLGIPEEKQKTLFGSQVKPTMGTESEKGVGLGLVLCHDFIQAMNGSINFKSKLNEGTEFIITLAQAN
jgi:signal transduction histidine kinase